MKGIVNVFIMLIDQIEMRANIGEGLLMKSEILLSKNKEIMVNISRIVRSHFFMLLSKNSFIKIFLEFNSAWGHMSLGSTF